MNDETRINRVNRFVNTLNQARELGLTALDEFELCPTLDLRVDYMRPAEPHKPVFARAETYKITKNIIFTRCEAYQEGGETIANCVGTFMRIGKEATPKSYRDLITGGAE